MKWLLAFFILAAVGIPAWAIGPNTIILPGPSTTDIGLAINNSVTANGSARYVLTPGTYSSATAINPSSPITLECSPGGGNAFANSSPTGNCVINVAANVEGFKCNVGADGSVLRGINFLSANSSSGTNNGLDVQCYSFKGYDLWFQGFGQDGVHVDSTTNNSNHWYMENVNAASNKRTGFYFKGIDVNVGICANCVAIDNLVNGFDNADASGGGESNLFLTPQAILNTNIDFNLGSYNTWLNTYCEGSGAMHLTGTSNTVLTQGFAPCVVTDSNPGTNFFYGSQGLQLITKTYVVNSSSPPVLTSCGSSPVVRGGSSNQSGEITLGSGSPSACTVTFANTTNNNLYCVVSPGEVTYTGAYWTTVAAGGFTLHINPGTSSAEFTYVCMGSG